MAKFWHKVLIILTALLVVGILIVISGQHRSSHSKPIRVVSSLNFYGEAAKKVAGKYGQVTTFINNSAVDPHDYQAGTKQARSVAQANVIIANGLGYDSWLNKMATANDKNDEVINVATDIAHKQNGANEHVWYRPQTMKLLTRRLAKRYARLDPTHRQYYLKRAQRYEGQLGRISREIDRCKQHVNSQDRLVDVTEPVFDYALVNLGYKVNNPHFAKAIEDDNDPSPSDISRMQNDIIHHKIAFLVVNTQETNGTINNMTKLARHHHIPLLKVTESEPAHKSYIQWMISQYQELLHIQQSKEESSSH